MVTKGCQGRIGTGPRFEGRKGTKQRAERLCSGRPGHGHRTQGRASRGDTLPSQVAPQPNIAWLQIRPRILESTQRPNDPRPSSQFQHKTVHILLSPPLPSAQQHPIDDRHPEFIPREHRRRPAAPLCRPVLSPPFTPTLTRQLDPTPLTTVDPSSIHPQSPSTLPGDNTSSVNCLPVLLHRPGPLSLS